MKSRHRRALTTGAVALLAPFVLAACGASSDGTSGSARRGDGELAFVRNPAVPQPSTGPRERGAAAASIDPVRSHQKPARARYPVGGEEEEAVRPVKPCTLVTKAEAARIVGRRMRKVWEAPQGPTCLYQPKGTKRYLSLAVESLSFSSVRRHSRVVARRPVRGRTAYCVRYGTVTTFVPLSHSRVLNITASCGIAARFAARALPRVDG
jgi:hypothetical protein